MYRSDLPEAEPANRSAATTPLKEEDALANVEDRKEIQEPDDQVREMRTRPQPERRPTLVDVELIPPRRPILQRIAPAEPARALLVDPTAVFSVLSLGLAVAMMPMVATMYVMFLPVRWMFGGRAER